MPRLEIFQGPGLEPGKVFEIPDFESAVIGRSRTADIVIDDASVSRKHAELTDDGTQFIIRDLHSANGTWIGGRRVDREVLRDGMEVEFGSVRARFRESHAYEVDGPYGSDNIVVTEPEGADYQVHAETPAEGRFLPQGDRPLHRGLDNGQLEMRLDRLIEIGEMVSDVGSVDDLAEAVVDELLGLFPRAHRAALLLRGQRKGRLVARAFKHRDASKAKKNPVMSRTILRKVIEQRKGVLVSNVATNPLLADAESVNGLWASSIICAPLVRRGAVLGVIQADAPALAMPFNEDDMRMLVSIAGPVALAVQNLWDIQEREQAILAHVLPLVRAMETRDECTGGHSDRVAEYAVAMGKLWNRKASQPEALDLRKLRLAACLHDVGRIAVRDAILNKRGPLTDSQMAHVRMHALHTERILKGMALADDLEDLVRIASLHHERYDGTGYPHGLSGNDIPIESAILAVADAYDAVTSNRPYRRALSTESAIDEMRKATGSQLNPAAVGLMLLLHEEGGIKEVEISHRGNVEPDTDAETTTWAVTPSDGAPASEANAGCGGQETTTNASARANVRETNGDASASTEGEDKDDPMS